MNSVWADSVRWHSFPALEGDITADVLIIGGGMAGILCAYMLKKSGVDCALIEAARICSGVTKNTTAKITLQHGLIYDKLIRRLGRSDARLYLQAQKRAMNEYATLCSGIDCDYETADSYVYSLDNHRKIMREVNALKSLGVKAELCQSVSLPLEVAGAVRVKNQAQFNPLKFAFLLAEELPIYENTKALELMKDGAVTEHCTIRCKKIIIATHFPVLNKHGGYFLKLYQHRSYVIALENSQSANGMYVDESEKGLSFRDYNGLLLLGGGAHRTGKKGGNWRELEAFANRNYPHSRVVSRWATQDCMTLDGVPYIGQYSKSTPDLFVATGFNKWGMTNSMVAAELLTDLVQGRKNKYEYIFSPSRSMLTKQLAINAFESVAGLITPTAPRCPHLGCALKYNPDEHSWDCPCHGSRFTEDGQLIDNPATDDKNLN